jgi:hypothetical protein
VRLNATFGLARGGDHRAEARLLEACQAAHETTDRSGTRLVLQMLAAALEDPALTSAPVVARFQALAQNPAVTPATRERALQVLRGKGAVAVSHRAR